ncbi:MAG: SurA N-terminal domain-containing protein [Deltaproteobacteria bacterium]|nr:SurA N-terminal domain-containing protein [Deltaproteobacteria bacterium]
MRKHARSTFIKVIFWMIIIVFVFWGVGVMVSGGNKVNVAAMVNGEPITAQEYARAFENMQRVYQQLYREKFTPEVVTQLNLHQRALDDLVNDMLLKREARRLGLQVTDDEVREAILNVPNFRSGDRFDRTRYLAALRATRTTPAEFEESQRESLLISKLENLLTDGITVSDREIRDLFALDHDTIDVTFVKVPYAKYFGAATVTEAEVGEYYEKNREVFRQPERVTLTYVAYTPKDLEASVAVGDESVAAYYDAHQSDYETPETAHLREILFVVPADADAATRAAMRATAESVLAEAKGGGDFAALARAHSGDPLTKDAGGDLGSVERGKLDTAIDDAAFALEPGQVSDLVEISRGFAIVKVEEKRGTGTQPLTEVRDQIERALRESGAEQAARDAVDADLEKARAGSSLEDLAATHGLKATTLPSAARGHPLPGVTNPILLATALGLDTGAVEEVVGTEPPYYLFKVVEKTPSDFKLLAAAHDQIVETVRAHKAREAARGAAEELLTTAKAATGGTEGLATAARAKGYATDDTGPFTRTQALPKLSGAPIKDELFALTKDNPFATVHELPDAAVVLALKARAAADESSLGDTRDTMRDGATVRKRSAVLEAYRDMLRQRADITINPDIVTGTRT